MNICMMTNTYLPHVGGVARSVHTFSEQLRGRGHDVLIVAPTFIGGEQQPDEAERSVVRLPAIQEFNGSDFSVRLPLTWLVDPRLNAFPADLVHSHHPFLLGDSALRYAAEKNAPVVFTHHTLYEEYTHYVPFDSPALREFVIQLCTHYANLCDAVIAPSESVATLLAARGVSGPIEVIPTGVDVGAFAGGRRERFRAAHDLPANAFVIGHLGRLAPEKNLGYLGRVVAGLLEGHPEARFLVVGDGPSARPMVEQFAARQVEHQLVMTGTLTGRELCDAYAAMDLFVFASVTETQGMVLAEAMAAGVPVVALDAPGVREVVHDGVNGILLERGVVEADFVRQLELLQADVAYRRRLARGARRTARRFSRETCARKLMKVYGKVLKNTRRERERAAEEALGTLRKRIEVEWSLLTQKAGAVYEAMTGGVPARPF